MTASVEYKKSLARYLERMDAPAQATFDHIVASLVAAAAVRNPDMAALSAQVDAHNAKVAALAAGKGWGIFYALKMGLLASERAALITKMASFSGEELDAHSVKVTSFETIAEGLPLPRVA